MPTCSRACNPSPDDTKERSDHRDDSACGRVQDGGLEEGKGNRSFSPKEISLPKTQIVFAVAKKCVWVSQESAISISFF